MRRCTKKRLTKSPIAFEFEYGLIAEGCWVYEHMVLQIEDSIDCLTVLFPDHEFFFLLGHSCGHRQWEDGWNIENMNKSYGGNKPKM
jgi:hypothetical protein